MAKLTERDIIAPFLGKAVNQENFKKIGYNNGGNKYLICNADYINKEVFCTLFGITDRLKWMWGYSGVDFTLCLTFDNWTVTECHLYKCREGGGGHGRPVSTVLTETQQELRVARRILQYITK